VVPRRNRGRGAAEDPKPWPRHGALFRERREERYGPDGRRRALLLGRMVGRSRPSPRRGDSVSLKRVSDRDLLFPPSGAGRPAHSQVREVPPEFGYQPRCSPCPARIIRPDESLLAEIPRGARRAHAHSEPYGLYRKLTGKAKGSAVDVNVNVHAARRCPERNGWPSGFAAWSSSRRAGGLAGHGPDRRRLGPSIRGRDRVLLVASYTCALLGGRSPAGSDSWCRSSRS